MDGCACDEQLLLPTDTGGKIGNINSKINNVLFMPCPPLLLLVIHPCVMAFLF
jgi:hypothetical protein